MQLVELEMLNYCQFQHKVIPFGPGLTAIIGANGAGKSNSLGAILFALAGIINNAGPKAANICQLAGETERSFVRLRFTHNNLTCEVKRFLRPDSAETTLDVTGEAQVTGDRRVTERIMTLLDIDLQILTDIVIVAQGEMFGFLARTPAKRAEAFQRIFHLIRAKLVHKALGTHVSGITVVDVTADLAARREELDLQLQTEAGCNTTLQGDTDIPTLTRELESLRTLRGDFERRPGLVTSAAETARILAMTQGSLRTNRETLQSVEQQIATHEASIARTSADIKVLEDAAGGCKEAADRARGLLATIAQRKQIEQTRQSLSTQIATAQTEVDAEAPAVPPMPTGYAADLTPVLTEQTVMLGAKASLDAFIASFDPQTGVAACPTCGTATAHLLPRIEPSRNLSELHGKRLKEISDWLTTCRNYEAAVRTYTTNKSNYDKNVAAARLRLTGLQQQLANLGTAAVVTEEPIVLSAIVNEHQDYLDGLGDLRMLLPSYEGALTPLRQQRTSILLSIPTMEQTEQQLIQRKATQDAEIAAITVTQEQIAQNNLREAWLDNRIAAINSARTTLALTQTALVATRARIAELEQQDASTARLRAWLTRAQKMRDLVHHDAAPKFVTQRSLEMMTAATNENLSIWDADFRVTAAEGLTYIARFFDGRVQPAERLSGGQQVVLAMVFRLALNSVYADVGFLALDEPTAYLDEHHIAGFEPALGRLREFAATRGLQCLIITHEERLAPLFDAVIRL